MSKFIQSHQDAITWLIEATQLAPKNSKYFYKIGQVKYSSNTISITTNKSWSHKA